MLYAIIGFIILLITSLVVWLAFKDRYKKNHLAIQAKTRNFSTHEFSTQANAPMAKPSVVPPIEMPENHNSEDKTMLADSTLPFEGDDKTMLADSTLPFEDDRTVLAMSTSSSNKKTQVADDKTLLANPKDRF